MSIIISDNISLNSRQFLDNRVGHAKTIQDLRDWDVRSYNIPDGFEVWVDSARKWYMYDSMSVSGSTGYFRERVGNSKDAFSDSRDKIATREFWGFDSGSTESEIAEVLYEGKNVSVIDELYGTQIYILKDADNPFDINSWSAVGFNGAGVQIYTRSQYDSLASKPDEWISIPDDDEGLEVESTETVISKPGTNLDIIFRALRALQAEVTRLRNSFKYGMYSYTDENTAMSTEMFELSDTIDEPLWAVDESGLEAIPECCVTISQLPELEPKDLIRYDENTHHLLISGDASNTVKWSYNDGSGQTASDLLSEVYDSKIFAYFSSTNENIKLTLTDLSGETQETMEICFNDFISNAAIVNNYSSMICISRKVDGLGFNFIWISILNSANNQAIQEGYYNPHTPNRLSDSIVELDTSYTIGQIEFWDTSINKINLYSKYQDFSKNIIPTQASDTTYKYEVAHITIRSVGSYQILEKIKDQLPENELIFVKDSRQLWIKSGNSLISLSNNNKDTGMTEEEVIALLKGYGIVYDTATGLELSSVGDITFINQDNNKMYMYKPNSEGELVGHELPNVTLPNRVDTLSEKYAVNGGIRINGTNFYKRGFCALLNIGEENVKNGTAISPNAGDDMGLNSDRVKIGAIYAPLSSDKIFGCSHAYVELENTSDKDFQLDGCYLHYFYQKDPSDLTVYVKHLALDGKIPKNSTYLIRGKQYSDAQKNKNTFIDVKTYDKEWWSGGELIDFTINNDIQIPKYGFMLTYGQPGMTTSETFINDKSYIDYFIDSIGIGVTNELGLSGGDKTVNNGVFQKTSNCIYRNTFELDPAKQAYQSLDNGKKDSSRVRWASKSDLQYLMLNKKYITFPHTNDVKCDVSMFTPKASFEGKNVCTDKTHMDVDRPNAVTCAFGCESNKVRCFNWVSAGLFNEYLWIREEGSNEWSSPIESYKNSASSYTGSSIYSRVEYEGDELTSIYNRVSGVFPGIGIFYTAHKLIINIDTTVDKVKSYEYIVGRMLDDGNPDPDHTSEIQYFHLYPSTWKPVVYQTTDQQGFNWIEYQVWGAAAKKINEEINSKIYTEVSSPVVSGLSDYFEVDETGHYKYTKDSSIVSGKKYYTHNQLVPVLVNTGDMTQNGTRINEWLDHFIGAKSLIDHLEYMCIVGNNDLCGTNVSVLGTGDDNGKSNSYYFHVFYCYQTFNLSLSGITSGECGAYEPNYNESDGTITNIKPIVNGKYVPSLYYFTIGDYGFAMINSEITFTNCKEWFGLVRDNKVYNIYTGWEVSKTDDATPSQTFINTLDTQNFTTIYTMVLAILKRLSHKYITCMCHEMPFTVMTKACMSSSDTSPIQYERYRSESNAANSDLIGCHMNQLTSRDNGRGTYWFSRLLEKLGITLVIGGHKHTFSCTWPLAENYNINESVNAVGEATLVRDNINWFADNYTIAKVNGNPVVKNHVNLTKFPKALCPSGYTNSNASFIDPICYDGTLEGKVTYFMCQATGYKLTSNKELPGQQQLFSRFLPKTGDDGSTASNEQKFPMFSRIDFNGMNASIYLARVENIMVNGAFTQTKYETGEMYLTYGDSYYSNLTESQIISTVTQPGDANRYGNTWLQNENELLTVKLNTI